MKDPKWASVATRDLPIERSLLERTLSASAELAKQWCVPESWIREQVRSRSDDPIPHIRLGKYVRFDLESQELADWLGRRMVKGGNRPGPRTLVKEK